jgi:hypothetical protein
VAELQTVDILQRVENLDKQNFRHAALVSAKANWSGALILTSFPQSHVQSEAEHRLPANRA